MLWHGHTEENSFIPFELSHLLEKPSHHPIKMTTSKKVSFSVLTAHLFIDRRTYTSSVLPVSGWYVIDRFIPCTTYETKETSWLLASFASGSNGGCQAKILILASQ